MAKPARTLSLMIAEMSASLVFPVTRVGSHVYRDLNGPIEGRIAAMFRSSIYFEAGSLLLCLGTRAMEPGPLNAVTTAPPETDWTTSGMRGYARARLSKSEIRVGRRYRFPLSDCSEWSPEAIRLPVNPRVLAKGIAAFKARAVGAVPDAGLGQFIVRGFVPKRHHFVCRAAETSITNAKRWLFQAFVGPRDAAVEKARWVKKLIGLGPGLTPSGDDFLGGMMIALHSIGEHGLCSRLWPEIYQSAAASTNPISFTHLKAASEGMGSKCIHRAISDMTGGNAEAMFGSMVGINRIGHTSGWDTVAGIVLTFEVWLQASEH